MAARAMRPRRRGLEEQRFTIGRIEERAHLAMWMQQHMINLLLANQICDAARQKSAAHKRTSLARSTMRFCVTGSDFIPKRPSLPASVAL
jgi:hypothetical protein